MEYAKDGNTNYNWCAQNGPQRFDKGTGRAENWRTSWAHPNYRITKISQNTEKILGNLWRLATTQAPVKDYELEYNNDRK